MSGGARTNTNVPPATTANLSHPRTHTCVLGSVTRRHQWAILLFWGVFYAVFTIISLLFNGIAGVIAALIASGTGAMLVAGLANGIASVVSGMLICALAVAMHGQLSGDTDTSIADTFE